MRIALNEVALRNGILHQPLFETSSHKDSLSFKALWVAILAAFVVANAPPKRLTPLVLEVLQLLPPERLIGPLKTEDFRQLAQSIVLLLIVPLKKLSFFLAVLVIGYPVVKSLVASGPFWRGIQAGRIAWSAGLLFLFLSILAVPYGNPNGPFNHRAGLAGLGVFFGEMSVAPFESNNDVVYGRLLKPALAHFIHMDGYIRYYLFSLICTYTLVFLTVVFLKSKSAAERLPDQAASMHPAEGWLISLSVMTSSFVMTSFQSPGKADHVVFIFMLLMACIPMTPQARLAIVALCMLTHEAIALALVPMIVFWFPKEEKAKALLVIGLFYAAMAVSYGFHPSQALAEHGSTVHEGSVWQVMVAHPGYFLLGLFFSYKLLWVVFVYVVWQLWAYQAYEGRVAALQLATIVSFPALLCVLAWDTSRIGGVGFLGMLVAMVLVMTNLARPPKLHSYVLRGLIYVNLVIPSYNIILYPPVGDGPPIFLNTLADYPYLGLYRIIHSTLRMLLMS